MFGAHVSIAGGIERALTVGSELGMDCVQVFTKNERRWEVPALTEERIGLWEAERRRVGIDVVVSHDSYLINLASPSEELLRKSIGLFVIELERCAQLGIGLLVIHPGAHVGSGEAAGIKRIAGAIDEAYKKIGESDVVTCLEVCAGQGTTLGYRFEQLRDIIDMVKEPERLAVCFDTAHAFAAGYDLSSEAGARTVLDELDDVLGLEQVKVLHLNDSKVECGKRVDRHEHIGHGYIGIDGFRVIVNHEVFVDVPKIIETKKGEDENGRLWDVVNIEALRNLMVNE